MIRTAVSVSLVAAVALLAGAMAGLAQAKPVRSEIWDLELGREAQALPDEFAEYACGGNGGPPAIPLAGFTDFRRCRAEPDGLREVYFRYDDELEYWAKAHNLATEIEQFSGTRVYNFPVIASALFNDAGRLAGLRIVSDARDPSQRREDAHVLRNFLTARYGREGWECVDLPAADGEAPVGRTFIKQSCRKSLATRAIASLDTRLLRKRGQEAFDPRSGRETQGQFESRVRFELRAAE